MILKASQRGGGKALALHLLKTSENEHVEVHEVRGFVSEDVAGAFKEAHAVSQGTRCKQYLFSVSLNPPENEHVRIEVFEQVLARIEERSGLSGQPRVVVFHEKEGRRHCHAVWSRINAEEMKAVPLPHFKMKLRDLSRDIYLEQSWRLPRGLMNSKERDPRNFTLAEWQEAKRAGQNARDIKEAILESWAASDSKSAFARALETRGLYLARGDRRGHVAVTYEGLAVSIARATGKKAKDIHARLGDPAGLRSVEETKAYIAERVAPRLDTLLQSAERERTTVARDLNHRRHSMRAAHALERDKLQELQRHRQALETRMRAERLRTGVRGLWDRITGERHRTLMQNDREAMASLKRDADQREALRASQLLDRHKLQIEIADARRTHRQKVQGLYSDLVRLREGQKPTPEPRPERPRPAQEFREAAAPTPPKPPPPKSPADRLAELRSSKPAPGKDRDFER